MNQQLLDPNSAFESPFELSGMFDATLSQMKTEPCGYPGAEYGTMPYHAFGYGRYAVRSWFLFWSLEGYVCCVY